MKKLLLISVCTILTLSSILAQVPEAINFQAIARDQSGNILANTGMQIRMTIIDSTNGVSTDVYQELRAVTTNAFGSFSFQIGKNPNFSTGIFSDIAWTKGYKFLKIDYDPTNQFNWSLTLGTIQLVSVPYALAAAHVSYIDITDVQNGDILVYNDTTQLFETMAFVAPVIEFDDQDSTNELQSLNEVLMLGNDGGGNLIKNIADPVDNQDAVTKAYIDQFLQAFTQADELADQYMVSGHSIGAYVGYAGYRIGCIPCHSHEGYTAFFSSYCNTDNDFNSANPIQCKTCHNTDIDLTYNTFRGINPVIPMDPTGTLMDFGNETNLCLNCHQARRGFDDYRAYAGDTLNYGGTEVIVYADNTYGFINSSHAGPHHGPQANLYFGQGGLTASSYSAFSGHASVSCSTCHMGVEGTGTGGHTFNPNPETCNSCHGDTQGFAHNNVQTLIASKLATLRSNLESAGLLDVSGGYPIVGTYDIDLVKAWWNYMYIEEDRSQGVHNPPFFNAMLDYAIVLSTP